MKITFTDENVLGVPLWAVPAGTVVSLPLTEAYAGIVIALDNDNGQKALVSLGSGYVKKADQKMLVIPRHAELQVGAVLSESFYASLPK